MSEAAIKGFDLFATDASGQRKFSISNFPSSAKIRDLIKTLVPRMGLNTTDTAGRPLDYQVFSKRESCHLRGSDSIARTLQDGDEISLLPDIQAG